MDSIKIYWSKPIEAVHTDGRVVSVRLDPEYPAPGIGGNYTLDEKPAADSWYTWTADGKSWMDDEHEWTIRNVAPKEVEWGPAIEVFKEKPFFIEPDTVFEYQVGACAPGCWHSWLKPDWDLVVAVRLKADWESVVAVRLKVNHPYYDNTQTHTYTVAPEDEAALNASPHTPTRTALEQRMQDFVRRVAMLNLQSASLTGTPAWNVGKEAADLRAELPEPVSPDRTEAKRLAEIWTISEDAAYEILSRGRALEMGESPVTNEGAGR